MAIIMILCMAATIALFFNEFQVIPVPLIDKFFKPESQTMIALILSTAVSLFMPLLGMLGVIASFAVMYLNKQKQENE